MTQHFPAARTGKMLQSLIRIAGCSGGADLGADMVSGTLSLSCLVAHPVNSKK
jgi:hypothetical protein